VQPSTPRTRNGTNRAWAGTNRADRGTNPPKAGTIRQRELPSPGHQAATAVGPTRGAKHPRHPHGLRGERHHFRPPRVAVFSRPQHGERSPRFHQATAPLPSKQQCLGPGESAPVVDPARVVARQSGSMGVALKITHGEGRRYGRAVGARAWRADPMRPECVRRCVTGAPCLPRIANPSPCHCLRRTLKQPIAPHPRAIGDRVPGCPYCASRNSLATTRTTAAREVCQHSGR
jgi:hypothetical protein